MCNLLINVFLKNKNTKFCLQQCKKCNKYILIVDCNYLLQFEKNYNHSDKGLELVI